MEQVWIFWVPSHGKKNTRFHMPSTQFGTEEQWREWNEVADQQAEKGREANERYFNAPERERMKDDAESWSLAALERGMLGFGQYLVHSVPESAEKWREAFLSYEERNGM